MKLSDEEVVEQIRDALAIWADAEPVPEPALSTVVELTPSNRSVPRRESRWIAAAAALVLVSLGAIVAFRPDGSSPAIEVGPDPSSITEIAVGRSFGVRGLESTDDAVWVTSQFDEQLYRVDPVTNSVVGTFPIPEHIEGIRAFGGSLWLSRYDPDEVIEVDPTTGALTTRLAFESQPSLVDDGEHLWAIALRDGEGKVVQIDPVTAEVVDEFRLGATPGPAVIDGDVLWVANHGSTTVSTVDLAERSAVGVIDVGGEPRSIVAAGGSIWVAVNSGHATGVDAGGGGDSEPTGSVVRIDPLTAEVTSSVTTGRWIHSVAADGDAVWATNFRDGTVSVIDVRSAALIATTPIGNRPGGVAIGHGSIWITPHRRNVLVRIDLTAPLEAAAGPDIARSFDVGSATTYIRCSGNGSPTVILEGNTGEGAAWAVVEARLARTTRVCVFEPVGTAEPAEDGPAGPASKVADELGAALSAIGEDGPFVVVGEWFNGYYAQLFADRHRDSVVALVLVNGVGADYINRSRALLPADALERFENAVSERPDMHLLEESAAEVAGIEGFGDLPLVVLANATGDPAVLAATSDPILTVAETAAIGRLLEETRREIAAQSTDGRVVVADGEVTPTDIVDATLSLLER